MTPNQRLYCEMARKYQNADDHGNIGRRVADHAMRDLENTDPVVAALAAQYTDDELIAMLAEQHEAPVHLH